MQHAKRIIYLSHKYPFEIFICCILSQKKRCANQEFDWIHVWWEIQHQQINWYLSLSKSKWSHKEHFWDNSCVIATPTKKQNAISFNNFEDIIVRVIHSDDVSTMSISSHELNACWKQLNITFGPTGRDHPYHNGVGIIISRQSPKFCGIIAFAER